MEEITQPPEQAKAIADPSVACSSLARLIDVIRSFIFIFQASTVLPPQLV